jgi:hypothetical protein
MLPGDLLEASNLLGLAAAILRLEPPAATADRQASSEEDAQ